MLYGFNEWVAGNTTCDHQQKRSEGFSVLFRVFTDKVRNRLCGCDPVSVLCVHICQCVTFLCLILTWSRRKSDKTYYTTHDLQHKNKTTTLSNSQAISNMCSFKRHASMNFDAFIIIITRVSFIHSYFFFCLVFVCVACGCWVVQLPHKWTWNNIHQFISHLIYLMT